MFKSVHLIKAPFNTPSHERKEIVCKMKREKGKIFVTLKNNTQDSYWRHLGECTHLSRAAQTVKNENRDRFGRKSPMWGGSKIIRVNYQLAHMANL